MCVHRRSRRLKQGARLVATFKPMESESHTALQTSSPVETPTGGTADEPGESSQSDGNDALARVQVTPQMAEVVDLVLGTHWEAVHEIINATVRNGRQKIESAASRRATATMEQLQQLTAEVQSKVKINTLHQVLKHENIDKIMGDIEAHIKQVTAVVRKDHEDWLLSHLDFLNDLTRHHAGSLHGLFTQLASEHQARLSEREARIEQSKELRIDKVTEMVTEQVRQQLKFELESRMWTEKSAMEKQEMQLRNTLAEDQARREAAESTIKTLQRAADAQLETMQVAFDSLEHGRLAVEKELQEARGTITGLQQEAARLATETREREKRERERIFATRESLDQQSARLADYEEKEKRYPTHCTHPFQSSRYAT